MNISEYNTRTAGFNIEIIRKKSLNGKIKRVEQSILNIIDKIEREANWGNNYAWLDTDNDCIEVRQFLRDKGFKIEGAADGVRIIW